MSGRRILLGVSLCLVALAPAGCVRNLCEDEPTDPHCTATGMPPAGAITVAPPRLSLTAGGPLAIAVQPAAPDGTMAVLRRAGASDLSLGTLQGGSLAASVKAADLSAHNFTPGPATIVLQQPGQAELSAPMRLYIEPQFTQPVLSYDTKSDGDFPTWVGIGNGGTVYGLNLYPPFPGSLDRKQRLVDYHYVAGATPAMDRLDKRMPMTFGGYKVDPFSAAAPARALLAGGQILVASFDKSNAQSPVIVDSCLFSTGQCNTQNPMSFDFKSVLGMATDPRGSVFAVQSDSATLAYRPSDMSPFAAKLAVDPVAMPAQVVALAVGDLDGDGQSDVVAVGKSPLAVTVLMQKQGGRLQASAERSAQLLGFLGGQTPTAATIADLDGDGLEDLILVHDGMVAIYYSQDNGALVAGPQLPALAGVDSVAAGAVAGSARPGARPRLDLAFGSSSGQRVGVLLNQAAF
jgi:hypothetical protein